MAAVEYTGNHNFLTVEKYDIHRRRGSSGALKPARKFISGLRAHKSSEELHRAGTATTPSNNNGQHDHISQALHLFQDGCCQPLGFAVTRQGAAPIIQVQTPSPTLSRRNMKKSSQIETHPSKRRKSPMSKQRLAQGEGGSLSSTPTATTARHPRLQTTGSSDNALLSDGPHSLDESETADGSTTAMALALASNGGSGSDATGEGDDTIDGAPSQARLVEDREERKRQTLDYLQHKVKKTQKLMDDEQKIKEEHVNEYLRLSNNADKQQKQRIKQVFEKRNQKSTHTIAHLQKKKDVYSKKITEVETYGVSAHKQPKEVLKDVGQGLKGFFARDSTSLLAATRSRDSSPSNHNRDMGANIKEFSGGVVDNIRGAKETMISKPKEFAGLFKNKKYGGSLDNIHNIKLEESQGSTDDGDKRSHHGSGTLPARFQEYVSAEEDAGASDVTSESAISGTQSSPHATLQMSSNTNALENLRLQHYLEHIAKELDEHKELANSLQRSIHELKTEMKEQMETLSHSLEEERYRRERLEEQINDLTELHQNEVPNIRQDLVSMEEKMEYKLEERTMDLHELLDSCQTKISKMELQQQQQQLISMEGIDNSNFRPLIVKLLNVVLAVVGVVLVFVSTLANLLGPFLTTRVRILTTIALIGCIVAVWQNWSSVRDTADYLYSQYKHLLPNR